MMMAARTAAKRSGDVTELLPPTKGGVAPPQYSYVHNLVEQRERIYGGSGRVVDTPTIGTLERETEARGARSGGTLQSRTKTIRNREIRLRRMLLIEPRVPRNYRLTTQLNRSGQALFADLCLRIPAVLAAKPMQVRAVPLDDEDESLLAATRKEEWTHAVLLGSEGSRAILDQGRTSTWRLYWDNLVNAGEGCFQLTVRSDRWSEKARGFPRRRHYRDDDEDVPSARRRTGAQKYLRGVQAYKQGTMPLVLESLDPQMVYVQRDPEGVEDEGVVIAQRPYRETLTQHGLLPAGERKNGVLEGRRGTGANGEAMSKYLPGPNGLGEAYPISDFPTLRYQPDRVETATYYCSAKRARYLGLIPGGVLDPGETSGAQGDADDAAEVGVWAHYVDGVLVDWGPLWGPDWHPLPVFVSPALTTGIPDPNFEGLPVAFHLLELADLLDQILTMELHVAFWSAFPPIIEEDQTSGGPLAAGLPGDTAIDPEAVQRPNQESAKEQVTIEPGRYYRMKAGRTVRYLVMPPEATAHLERLYTKARELFDLLGVPGVFRGAGNEGQAGYAIAQLMIAAKSLYDPIVDNATTTVATAVKYLWWQVWRRFREGVPAHVGGEPRKDKRAGWLWLTPDDVAPGSDGPGEGVPFLQCSVKADPLLPTDEAQLELRGIRAVEAGMIDEDTAREKYFGDVAPEKTAARILGDKTLKHPLIDLPLVYRNAVRMGLLMPELAVAAMAKDLGVDAAMAFQQLSNLGTFSPQQQQAVQGLLAQQAALAPPGAGPGAGGPQPIPGVNEPGLPQGPGLPEVAPPAPAAPPINPGAQPGPGGAGANPPGVPSPGGGMAQGQPSTASRIAAAVAR